MSAECLGCGANLGELAIRCPNCQTAIPSSDSPPARPLRKRLSIPFATLMAMGLAWALLIGGGKPGNAHPVSPNTSVGASIDGKPVGIGGPAIALLERKLSAHVQGPRSGHEGAPGPTAP